MRAISTWNAAATNKKHKNGSLHTMGRNGADTGNSNSNKQRINSSQRATDLLATYTINKLPFAGASTFENESSTPFVKRIPRVVA